MARESYNSIQQRLRREADPLASGAWKHGVFDTVRDLKRAGVTELVPGDATCTEHGWSEDHLRRMGTGTGGMGLLNMRAVFTVGEPTALVPSGLFFSHYVFELV